MRPLLAGLGGLWLFTGAAAIAGEGRPPAQAPATPSPVWSGVYSAPQARRGLLEYSRSCEHCHGSTLTGNPTDEVPSLVADAFMFHWRGRTVQDLYTRLSKSMPSDAPGSLDADTYLDLVAYVLEANGFPPGQQDLSRDRLSTLLIEKAPSGQP